MFQRLTGRVCSGAVAAPAEDGEVRAIQHEAVLAGQTLLELVDEIGRRIEHRAAGVAHHVDVVVLGRPVRGCAVTQVGMAHEAELLEELERAIDGREIDFRDGLTDLFRCRVAEFANRPEHAVTLSGHAHATRAQLGREIRRGLGVGVGVHVHRLHRRYVVGVSASLVAVLGSGLVEPSAAILRADDLGVTRGDGCFEGCRVRTDAGGLSTVDKLDLHLARMARSAQGLELDFDEAAWRELIDQALEAWSTPGEAALKLVLTRGDGQTPTGFLTISDLSPDQARLRRDGLRVITLSRGTTPDAFADAPWLLGGIKTLSYAVNMAAMREAERRGADDVIFVTVDGQVLESPTSSVLWTVGRTLHTIATGPNGILGGTTARLLFERAEAAGWAVRTVEASVEDLHAADVLWLTSSVRGPVDIVELDGKQRSRVPAIDEEIRRLSGF